MTNTRKYSYNLVYIWLYIPWITVVTLVIRQDASMSRPAVGTIELGRLLETWVFGASVAWAVGVYTSIATTMNLVSEAKTFSGKEIGLLVVLAILGLSHGFWTLLFLGSVVELYIFPIAKTPSRILSGWYKTQSF